MQRGGAPEPALSAAEGAGGLGCPGPSRGLPSKGRYYQLDQPYFSPPNVQRPHPPILVGGGSEKYTLRTVAKYADAANLEGTPEEVRHKYQVLDEHCREVGRDPGTIRRTLEIMLFLNDDPAFQQRIVQELMTAKFRPTEEESRRFVLLGSADDVETSIREFIDAGVQEVIVWQVPRVHLSNLLRFSDEVIPAFS